MQELSNPAWTEQINVQRRETRSYLAGKHTIFESHEGDKFILDMFVKYVVTTEIVKAFPSAR